jgi:hypothetical protein
LLRAARLRIKYLEMRVPTNSQTCWQFLQTMKLGVIFPNRSARQFDLNARLAGCSHD